MTNPKNFNDAMKELFLGIPEPPPAYTKIGPYKVIKQIGEGGMGEVYKVQDSRTKKLYALKTLLQKNIDNENSIRRFSREMKLAANLDHPNIVKVYHKGYYKDILFFTMELIPGAPLNTKDYSFPLHHQEIIHLVIQVAEALCYAHKKGVIHRDLKPANIMINAGEPKIVDFGLAKFVLEESQQLTSTGNILGTIAYMAPEQALEGIRDLDQRSDIFSLGAILYKMLTGKCPFPGVVAFEVFQNLTSSRPPKAPQEIKSSIPEELSQICLKAIAKCKEQRYQKMEDFKNDLLAYSERGVN